MNAALKAARREPPAAVPADARHGANGHVEPGPSELGTLIALLPERRRLALFLRYSADLDYRGIARALDVEVGTVSATLSAAHAALRRALRGVAT